ncbi:MAG: metallo-mystery pair system four-Cys motif protein [Myxococcota bacterium]|nr:metallo-mystery pair system four-Cys motif protein [Myxococcota bacterium]
MRSLSILLLVFGLACTSDDPSSGVALSLRFDARVGDAPFACGTTYEGLGTEGASFMPTDLRFYVHDVRLVAADGTEVPFAIEDDGRFQRDGVALLDFEDGCGDQGNPDLHGAIEGRAPEGEYVGVRFRVGVPETLNHANTATAPTPMNLTAMWWSWNAGYKFVRLEGRSSAFEGWRLHLGSTGCTGDMMGTASCTTANVVDVALDGFDARHRLRSDLRGARAAVRRRPGGHAAGLLRALTGEERAHRLVRRSIRLSTSIPTRKSRDRSATDPHRGVARGDRRPPLRDRIPNEFE